MKNVKSFSTFLNCIFLLLLFSNICLCQTVTTLVSEFPGDGEISFDDEGNIYVNDSGENYVLDGHSVYKVTPNGQYSLFSENLPIWVVGSIFDLDGNLLVTGWSAGTISRILPDGTSSVISTGINGAGSLEIDELGNIFVAEYILSKVLKFNSNGENPIEYAVQDSIQNPAGLAYLNATGDLFVSNWTNGNICKIDVNGDVSVFATLPVPNVGPIKIYGGYLFATSPQFHTIYKINMANPEEVIVFAGIQGVQGNTDGDIATATFNTPTGIGTLDGETFYIAEAYQNTGRLRVIEGVTLATKSLQKDADSKISIFPNPATSKVVIKTDLNNFSSFDLFVNDASGKVISTPKMSEIANQTYELDTSDLDPGLYFLVFKNNKTQQVTSLPLTKK